ncbi:helix-turn-helix domain-containing protein [Sphingomonas sp.]|uniref:helix-turn-helix domain-containing protein n=1 Tax=Sphingomonas sp. TaxID=28214 RepID=UPI001D6D4F23|nr:helix-turn-helix domain-containing protein [Sphingomonas sp.]MBX9797716.1 DUF4115 domain-containing protein [Sphingomonas sp.]
MGDAEPGEEATLFPKTVGEKLREARESQGLTLDEIAARTRVPMRHLEAIERGDYGALPSATYAVGFAKAYARAVGMDEVAVGREVRGTLPDSGTAANVHASTSFAPPSPPRRAPSYEAREPAKLPPRGLTAVLVIAAVLMVAATLLAYSNGWFQGDGSPPASSPVAEQQVPPPATNTPAPAAAAPATGGQVKLTATDLVWLRVYDADGATLIQRELQPGESYDVPQSAKGPMINIGRPDKLAITIDGQQVAPLGDGSRAIKDVAISADALRARSAPAANPAAGVTTPGAADPAAGASEPSRPRTADRRTTRSDSRRNDNETARANRAAAEPAAAPATPPAEQGGGDTPPPQP